MLQVSVCWFLYCTHNVEIKLNYLIYPTCTIMGVKYLSVILGQKNESYGYFFYFFHLIKRLASVL